MSVDVQRSTLGENDADGIEVDESDTGDVRLTARRSSFVDNGAQPQVEDDPEDGPSGSC